MTQRQEDIQALKDIIIPGVEYRAVTLSRQADIPIDRTSEALSALCNLDYLMFGIDDVAGYHVYRTI